MGLVIADRQDAAHESANYNLRNETVRSLPPRRPRPGMTKSILTSGRGHWFTLKKKKAGSPSGLSQGVPEGLLVVSGLAHGLG